MDSLLRHQQRKITAGDESPDALKAYIRALERQSGIGETQIDDVWVPFISWVNSTENKNETT